MTASETHWRQALRQELLSAEAPPSARRLSAIAQLYEHGEVLSTKDGGDHIEASVRVPKAEAARLRKLGVEKQSKRAAP